VVLLSIHSFIYSFIQSYEYYYCDTILIITNISNNIKNCVNVYHRTNVIAGNDYIDQMMSGSSGYKMDAQNRQFSARFGTLMCP